MNRTLRRVAAPVAAAAVLSGIVTSIVLGSGSGSVVAAPGEPPSNTVAVSGVGRVSGVPDVLRLDIGVERTGNDVNAALNAANADIEQIKKALDRNGVDDEDIQTSDLSINPHWERNRINGYDVYQTLAVKLRDLERAGRAISDAAAAGGNATRINGVSFDIEDNADLIGNAREAAFADAKAKAQQYAELAGGELGKVVLINEDTEFSGPPMPYASRLEAKAADQAVPIEAGTQQVVVNSAITWELV